MGWKAIGFEQKNLKDLPLAAMNPFRIIEEDDKIGVEHWFTPNKRVIIPAEYDYIEQVYVPAGIFFIVGLNRRRGVYDSEGKLIVDLNYNKIYFMDTLIIVCKGSCRGAYDYEGNHIVPDKYAGLQAYKDGIIVCTSKIKYGAYDYNGNHIVPDIFAECRIVSFEKVYENFFFVKNFTGYCGLYNKNGQEIIPVNYYQLTICEKFIIANTSNCFFSSTVYSYEGNVILPVSAYEYHNWNDVAIYYFDNGVKVCDATGKEFEPGMVYESVCAEHDEFLAVKLNGQWKVLCSA